MAKPSPISKNQVKVLEKKLGFSISANDPNIALYNEAAQWLGTPYRYGGMSKKGADCSGVTLQIYKAIYKKNLHRTSADMAKHDVRNISKNSLRAGDLIFFATSRNKKAITHVGVYLKNNYFIHASSKAGVVVNNLSEDYYKKTYKQSGRVK
jgi:cell wall-associated NlpC family hydrolase